jgi:hypothetical protein
MPRLVGIARRLMSISVYYLTKQPKLSKRRVNLTTSLKESNRMSTSALFGVSPILFLCVVPKTNRYMFEDLMDSLMDPSTFIGRAPEQVHDFLKEWVEPALKPYENALKNAKGVELTV